jgi:hypothetical protein
MSDTTRNQLRKLQFSLYEQSYKEASSIVEGQSKNLITYSNQFEKSLPDQFDHASLTEIIENLRQKQFILFGDFHTLRQCQRGFLRLIRNYNERMRDNNIVITLEMFKAKDQIYLDEFMNGEISERELLEAVNYAEDWGFPWKNFKMILEYAKAKNLPVFGINSDLGGKDTLKNRDKFAADTLCNIAEKYPDHKVFCLIGEYHLADHHLPSSLWKEIYNRGNDDKILRIVSNVDRYYFELPISKNLVPTDYIRLKDDFFCIMNTPPWMKWQSFSIWEEMRNAQTLEQLESDDDIDLDFHTENTFDVDYQFLRFVQTIGDFLGLPVDENDQENFNIYFSRDADFFDDIDSQENMNTDQINRIIGRTSVDGVYYLSESNSVLLSHISINNLAEAAGQYLQSLQSKFSDTSCSDYEQFYRRVIKAAVGMIGAKILNPRRKSNDLVQFKQFLYRHKGRHLHGRALTRKKAAVALIKHHEWIIENFDDDSFTSKKFPKSIWKTDQSTDYEISRILGHWLGHNYYSKIIQNKYESSDVQKLLFTDIATKDDVWGVIRTLYKATLAGQNKQPILKQPA